MYILQSSSARTLEQASRVLFRSRRTLQKEFFFSRTTAIRSSERYPTWSLQVSQSFFTIIQYKKHVFYLKLSRKRFLNSKSADVCVALPARRRNFLNYLKSLKCLFRFIQSLNHCFFRSLPHLKQRLLAVFRSYLLCFGLKCRHCPKTVLKQHPKLERSYKANLKKNKLSRTCCSRSCPCCSRRWPCHLKPILQNVHKFSIWHCDSHHIFEKGIYENLVIVPTSTPLQTPRKRNNYLHKRATGSYVMLIYLLVNSVLEVVPNGNIALEALLVALEGVTLNRTYKTLIKKSHERQKLPETQKENCLDKSPLILTRSPIRITANTINGSAVAAANRERILLLRCGDIEQNPGPEPRGEQQRKKFSSTVVTSYNVRGINDEKKLRHLINKVYKDMKRNSTESIICFQETFVEKEGKLSYLWRGNLHLTPGTGSSCGCLTLTSSNLNILEAADLDGRAHIISCQRTNEQDTAYVIANIYAPNPNNLEKIDFFDRVLDKVQDFKERFNCSNVIIAGDFNLIFDRKEAKNRQYTAQERRVADFVKENTEALPLFKNP